MNEPPRASGITASMVGGFTGGLRAAGAKGADKGQDHVHKWPDGNREEPGRPVSPWPRQ